MMNKSRGPAGAGEMPKNLKSRWDSLHLTVSHIFRQL